MAFNGLVPSACHSCMDSLRGGGPHHRAECDGGGLFKPPRHRLLILHHTHLILTLCLIFPLFHKAPPPTPLQPPVPPPQTPTLHFPQVRHEANRDASRLTSPVPTSQPTQANSDRLLTQCKDYWFEASGEKYPRE
ncbi:hypothetical protein AAFF_G00240510 [Aldrovandia affinis]|uniref:Uncharacterized protein n=1 Tax=Aldrovandia affinis TaxID=143900 RepID=A0AAD7SUR4_9TELE|nr:hypothetical protein AAFF_G00240510 [Aldrovandia affinis]